MIMRGHTLLLPTAIVTQQVAYQNFIVYYCLNYLSLNMD